MPGVGTHATLMPGVHAHAGVCTHSRKCQASEMLCISRPDDFDVPKLGNAKLQRRADMPFAVPSPAHRLVTCKRLSDLNFTSAALITTHHGAQHVHHDCFYAPLA